jgi:type VI secretion system protein ImpE
VTAKELFDAGQLAAAIEQLNHDVRAHPTDVRQRTFLFELLCFAGDYGRAARQLDVLSHQDAATDVGVQVYRNILTAVEARERLFTHGDQPDFLAPAAPYVDHHLQALQQLCAVQPAAAKALLEQAAQARPGLTGHLNGQAFNDFRNSDDILGCVLEVFIQRHYIWLPLEQIKQLTIPPPTKLRDLLWTPATLELHTGPIGDVFLPVLYPGSHTSDDDHIKLGRMTDWLAAAEGVVRGMGQHVFLVGEDEHALLEIRSLGFACRAQEDAGE